MTTHYLPPFLIVHGRQQQAACGAWVRKAQHSTEPTCPACSAYLMAEAADTRSAEELFGTPDPALVVAPPPDVDVVAEYHAHEDRHAPERRTLRG